jgi:hypothetical protein
MKTVLRLAAAAAGLLMFTVLLGLEPGLSAPRDDDEKKSDKKSEKKNETPRNVALTAFMRGKLDASQQVLEGLVTEDFELIQQGADQLRLMSMKSDWNVLQGPIYAHESAAFRKSTELLGKMAKDKSIDGAGLAYLQVTMHCLGCHKYVRESKLVELPPLELPGLPQREVALSR